MPFQVFVDYSWWNFQQIKNMFNKIYSRVSFHVCRWTMFTCSCKQGIRYLKYQKQEKSQYNGILHRTQNISKSYVHDQNKTNKMRHHKTSTISFLIWRTLTCIDIEKSNFTLPTSTLELEKIVLCCFYCLYLYS